MAFASRKEDLGTNHYPQGILASIRSLPNNNTAVSVWMGSTNYGQRFNYPELKRSKAEPTDILPPENKDTGSGQISGLSLTFFEDISLRILSLLSETPVEDGFPHPVEDLLDVALHEKYSALWCLNSIAKPHKTWTPAVQADFLRLLGRKKRFNDSFRISVIRIALASQELIIRDAAVQCAETWTDVSIFQFLKRHNEKVPWLKAFIQKIIVGI